jgi:hypothetical protein
LIKVNYPLSLCIKVSDTQRRSVERLAQKNNTTLGDAARTILDLGLKQMRI